MLAEFLFFVLNILQASLNDCPLQFLFNPFSHFSDVSKGFEKFPGLWLTNQLHYGVLFYFQSYAVPMTQPFQNN